MDKREYLKEQLVEGKIPEKAMPEAVWRCQNLKDLSETTYEDINHFYYPEEEANNEPGQA